MSRPIIGLVLAGGLSRRMGGGDKPLRMLGGRTILSRALEALRPQCAGLRLSINGDPARFAAFDVPVLPDTVPGSAGPLAGILAGLEDAAAYAPDGADLVSVPGDTPFLPADLVDRLRAARERTGAAIACAASGGRVHPAVALWPGSLAPVLRRALTIEGERKVGRILDRHATVTVDWDADPVDPFFNVNTPDDLAAAARLLEAGAP